MLQTFFTVRMIKIWVSSTLLRCC